MGDFFYWLWIICLTAANVIAIVYIIRAISDADNFIDFVGPVFCLIVCGAMQYGSMGYIGYTEKEIAIIDASEATIMHDEEEAIVKYADKRWDIKKIKNYTKVINGDFYIKKVEDFNVFGYSTGYSYSFETYEEEKPSDKSIPIEL